MQIAILSFSVIGAATGVASLAIMLKTAKELQKAQAHIEGEVEDVRNKVKTNAKVIRTALRSLEF